MEYKYVLLDHSGQHAIAWQRGNNSVLAVRQSDEFVEVFDNWWVRCAVLCCVLRSSPVQGGSHPGHRAHGVGAQGSASESFACLARQAPVACRPSTLLVGLQV